jgi:hypothetical protein
LGSRSAQIFGRSSLIENSAPKMLLAIVKRQILLNPPRLAFPDAGGGKYHRRMLLNHLRFRGPPENLIPP